MFHVPENCRIVVGRMGSNPSFGNNGAFELPAMRGGRKMFAIVSDGMEWEHVSVHVLDGKKFRTPTWNEMCHIKDLFWDEEDVVMQLHPKRSEYVNNHPYVLHLWRPTTTEIPTPPAILVGVK